MAGFLDVLLRGAMLVGGALALGGVVFVRLALRPHDSGPDGAAARSLRLIAAGGAVVAVAQAAIVLIAASAVGIGSVTFPAFAATPFAWASATRIVLATALAVTALALTRTSATPSGWAVVSVLSVLLVTSSAAISHAAARVDHRPTLLLLDALHQGAAAVWVGGLVHLLVWHRRHRENAARDAAVARRVSSIAAVCVIVLVLAGLALSLYYVGDRGALVETAYGVMVLTKTVLLLAMLALGAANYRLVRRAAVAASTRRLMRFVEVEIGLAVTVLFAAASLTSVPPAVDVRDDRASFSEVVARFTAMPPRFASPNVDDLLRQTNPLAGGPETRLEIERQWSESNHHWAGVFVLGMGLAAIAHGAGVRVARHWPLLMVGLAVFLFVRNDPEVWPLGPIGVWESLAQPEIAQHRMFMILVMLFGAFEWAVRVGRLPVRPWGYVFPMICAVGGGLLLTHSHTVFSLKEAFLMEVTHAPIGVLGAFAGWARWLELRLPDVGRAPGRIWRGCLVGVGVVLLFYSEG
jgi:putative copper resistance protein D